MIKAATLVGLAVLAAGAPASAVQTAPPSAQSAPQPTAAGLAADIRRAFEDARRQALAEGLSGEALESRVGGAVEGVIAASEADPAVVLEAVRIAMAQEQCLATGDGRWNRLGCAALDRVQQAVAAAVGGPSAIGGPGGTPTGSSPPPPGASAGPDYEDD